jgi:hypothetical protein
MKYLISKGANPNIIYEGTPLVQFAKAALGESHEKITYLESIILKQKPALTKSPEETLFEAASRSNQQDLALIKQLFATAETTPDIDYQDPATGNTALMAAILSKGQTSLDIINYLINLFADREMLINKKQKNALILGLKVRSKELEEGTIKRITFNYGNNEINEFLDSELKERIRRKDINEIKKFVKRYQTRLKKLEFRFYILNYLIDFAKKSDESSFEIFKAIAPLLPSPEKLKGESFINPKDLYQAVQSNGNKSLEMVKYIADYLSKYYDKNFLKSTYQNALSEVKHHRMLF